MDVDPGQGTRPDARVEEARRTAAVRVGPSWRRPVVWAWAFGAVFVASLAVSWVRSQERLARSQSDLAGRERDLLEVRSELLALAASAHAPHLMSFVDPVSWETNDLRELLEASRRGAEPTWLREDDGLVEDPGGRCFHAVAPGWHDEPGLALLSAQDAANKQLLGVLSAHVDALLASFFTDNADLYTELAPRDLVHHTASARRDVLRDVVVRAMNAEPRREAWQDPASGLVYVRLSVDVGPVVELYRDTMLEAFDHHPGLGALPRGRADLAGRLQMQEHALATRPVEVLQGIARRVGRHARR